MITKEPWFGPRAPYGWGWTPVTWQGWLVIGLCTAIILAALFLFRRGPMTIFVVTGTVAALILVCFLTGTPPG
jgi:hypothetical protein